MSLKDGLVSRASFSNLIDEAAAMPRAYGYAPSDADLWKNQQDKDASRQKMFDSMDLVSFNLLFFAFKPGYFVSFELQYHFDFTVWIGSALE